MEKDTVDKMTFEDALEWFDYDPYTGILKWKKYRRGSGKKENSVVGTVRPDGYIRVKFNGSFYYAHRIIWLMMYGEFPNGYIDHINRNPRDNRLENLRVVSSLENAQNCDTVRGTNKSGLLGAFFSKQRGKYISKISVNKELHYLGSYETAEEAHKAYMNAKTTLHKAYQNE